MFLLLVPAVSVGKTVLQEACRKESKSRAMYRSEEEAAKAPSGCEVVLADYSDKQSLRNALQGVTSVFVVCSPIPQLVDWRAYADACKESGEHTTNTEVTPCRAVAQTLLVRIIRQHHLTSRGRLRGLLL